MRAMEAKNNKTTQHRFSPVNNNEIFSILIPLHIYFVEVTATLFSTTVFT